jgi:hypothetical protein
MTCRDIDALFDAAPGNLGTNLQVLEHLDQCRGCRALLGAFDEVEQASLPMTTLKPIEAKIVKNLKPVRPLPSLRFFLFVCATIFLGAVCVGATPFGMAGWHALSVAQRTGVFAALTASALLLAFSMVGQMVPGSKYALAPRVVPIVMLAAVLVVLAVEFHPRAEPAFVASGLVCLKNGLTYSIPAAALFWTLIRRGAMLAPKVIGAAAGGLAGLTGLTVLEINCTNLSVFHILAWHWGVVLISTVFGTLFGATVKQIRRWHQRCTS